MKKKRLGDGLRGSFTIEASLILPVIIFLICNILYLSFFLYDQCTVLQGSYCTALRTERMTGGAAEKKMEAEEKYEQAVKEKVAAAVLEYEIEISEEGVCVETEFTVRAPGESLFYSVWKERQEQKADTWEPASFIRSCRKAENIWNLIYDNRKFV